MTDLTDTRTLEEQLAHCDGADCKCLARSEFECACDDVDWTPAGVYRLQSALATHVDRVCELTSERDALRARIKGADVVKASRNGIVRTEARMKWINKRFALVLLEDGE